MTTTTDQNRHRFYAIGTEDQIHLLVDALDQDGIDFRVLEEDDDLLSYSVSWGDAPRVDAIMREMGL